MLKKVCITGGAGYVGSRLVPHLLTRGYEVTVLDTLWYGTECFGSFTNNKALKIIKGDIRSPVYLREAFSGQDAVIHLACISNDPSFELDATLGKSINYDSFPGIIRAVRECGVKRFIYASSSSVYGVKDEPNVTEEVSLEPLTAYSKFKALCEEDLSMIDDFEWTVLRPATVCGYAPRLRLDLSVNILTISAMLKREITVFGGTQLRPNINIKDMVRAYSHVLEAKGELVHKQKFNVGFENKKISEIAAIVYDVVGDNRVQIRVEDTKDLRSYHVNSDKIERVLNFKPDKTIEDAIKTLVLAYDWGFMHDPLNNPLYYNIRQMKELGLS